MANEIDPFFVEYKARGEPRRRVLYKPAEHLPESYYYNWYRIEKSYDTRKDGWYETGRDLVAESTVVQASPELIEE